MFKSPKIGFACKYIDDASQVSGIPSNAPCKIYNLSSTTVSWLSKVSTSGAIEKLSILANANIDSLHRLVKLIGAGPELNRMFRIGSEILPMYTHVDWKWIYDVSSFRSIISNRLLEVGETARELGVRLSFHPGQFCCLSSTDPDIVTRSIAEIEYHTDVAKMMGYGKSFQDFKINVHISGRQGPAGIPAAYNRLSPEARMMVTLENDEISWGLEDCLSVSQYFPVVLDVHHHFIKTGEYITPNDPRVQRVIESWKGIRPVMHYSVSREDLLIGHDPTILPDLNWLLAMGFKKQKLRAHSDFFWNQAANYWALTFLPYFDIQTESKSKNLGARQLSALVTCLDTGQDTAEQDVENLGVA